MKTNRNRKSLKLALETLKHITTTELANVRGGEDNGIVVTDPAHSCNPACHRTLD